MLDKAKLKNPDKKFILGDILNMPFQNEEFDCATIAFGLRNIENRTLAISEIHRILKKGGLLLHLDFGKHNLISKIFNITTPFCIKIFAKNKSSYEYLIKSKNDYPEPDELINEFQNSGFKLINKKYYLFNAVSSQIFQKI